MNDMSCLRLRTPGDGRGVRQGTSLLYRAGEKTRASVPWGSKKQPPVCGRLFHVRNEEYSGQTLRCFSMIRAVIQYITTAETRLHRL